MTKHLDTWDERFGTLDLHNKVVGDSCIDWSHDHQIAIGTSKNVFLCDMSLLIGGKRLDEIGFMIDNLPVVETREDYNVGARTFLSDFEAACLKASNIRASPNYDVYKLFLDTTLCDEKKHDLKGIKSLLFSPTECSKVSCGELLSVLSLDHCVTIHEKLRGGENIKWELYANLSSILIQYLEANDGYFKHFCIKSDLSEFALLKEKKYSSSVCCLAWSDVYQFNGEMFCYIATATKNCFIVLWKIRLPVSVEVQPTIVDVFRSNLPDIVSINFKTNISTKKVKAPSLDNVCFAFSCSNGQICCISRTCNEESSATTLQETVWADKDRLSPRNLHWVVSDVGNLLLTAKSHVLVAMLLDDKLKVVEEFVLQSAHDMPIKQLRIFKNDGEFVFVSCSSDGLIVRGDISIVPQLELTISQVLGKPSDINSFGAATPSTMHGVALSPNKAFLAILTSRQHVRLSIQVDSVACLSLKRLITARQASERLLELTSNDNVSSCLYDHIDLIEIVREHYMMKKKFDDLLEKFLEQNNVDKERNITKLQLRWHLLKLKEKAKKTARKNALLECLTGVPDDVDHLKKTEDVLTIRQMMKVLTTWFHNFDEDSDCSIPIVSLHCLLEKHKRLLNSGDIDFLSKVKSHPSYKHLSSQQTCIITGLPIELSADGKSGSTSDGSRWPLCCLTFSVLQGYRKRKCSLSGLFATLPSASDPAWLYELLSSNCIFSGAPITQYINR